MERFLKRLVKFSLNKPRLCLGLFGLVTVTAAPGLLFLQPRTDGHALVPPDDPAVLFDAQVRERFHLRDPIIVLIDTHKPDGALNARTLGKVADLTRRLAALPNVGVENVVSLATEKRDWEHGDEVHVRTFLDPLPETPGMLDLLRRDIQSAGIVQGTLISQDASAVSIIVGAPSGNRDSRLETRSRLYRQILDATAPYTSEQETIHVVGAPVAESLLGQHVIQDLALLIPLSALVISFIIWIGCRRLGGVFIGLIEVVAALVFTFGVMGWAGVPIFITTAILPVILIALGLADEIHLFWRYQALLAEESGDDARPFVRRTILAMGRPIVLTSVTTALGFLSFAASGIQPVRMLGLFAALGIFFCLLFSLLAVPALLSLIPVRRMRRPLRTAPREHPLGWIIFFYRNRTATLAVLAVLTAALGAGLGRLFIQDGWIAGFSPQSAFRESTEIVNQKLLGTHVLLAQIEFPATGAGPADLESGGPLLRKPNLDAVGEFERFVRRLPQSGGVLGLHSQLTQVSYLWGGRGDQARYIPEDPSRIARLYRLLEQSRGKQRRSEAVDPEMRRAIVSIYLKDANYRQTALLMDAVTAYADEHLTPLGARVGFAGDVAVSQAMVPAIVKTQVLSLLLALGSAFLVLCIIYRSLMAGVMTLLPALAAVLWMFGALGWLGIPLGVATSMFCAITLGIGVDYGIHFYERFREADEAGEPVPAIFALRFTGSPILTDMAAIALGIGVLVFSRVPANSRLGMVVAGALAFSALLTLVGLGTLLARRQDRVPIVRHSSEVGRGSAKFEVRRAKSP